MGRQINESALKRVLIIPDAWYGRASGAIVARELCRHCISLDFHVGVCCCDIINHEVVDGVELYSLQSFRAWMNIIEGNSIREFTEILDTFRPTHIFFIGSITNKPLCYLEEGLRRGLHVNVFIFMQDFFCYKYYANDALGPCLKCLEKGFKQSIIHNCGKGSFKVLKQLLGIRNRVRLQRLLQHVNYVMTSSDDQIRYYLDYGINKERILKVPLFFDRNRVLKGKASMGNYYIGIAQNRLEKGFHLIPKILRHVNNDIKIILAYNSEKDASTAIKANGFEEFISKGNLEIRNNLTWDNGLGQAIACSRGVIIPSIWPTTTEFGLLEALGLGKPVFTYAVGIHREIFVNGENGYTFEIGDEKSFGQTLSNFSEIDYEKVSDGAFQLFNHLTEEEMWQRLLESSLE